MSIYVRLNQIVRDSFHAKIYEVREPRPGIRHDRITRYIPHRFPVKGGLSFAQVQVRKGNPLLDLVRQNALPSGNDIASQPYP